MIALITEENMVKIKDVTMHSASHPKDIIGLLLLEFPNNNGRYGKNDKKIARTFRQYMSVGGFPMFCFAYYDSVSPLDTSFLESISL